MYILLLPTALALLLALAVNLAPLFDFKRPRPMLEQIEEERWNYNRERMEMEFPYFLAEEGE